MKKIFLSAPHMSGAEQSYIAEAFSSNWIAPLGPNVESFEEEMCQIIGAKHALALSSGTAAIHLALKLLDVKAGDSVFCSSLTFSASANPILYEKGIPVFVDSDEESWNLSPVVLEEALRKRAKTNTLPKAIIVVDLYGQSADYDAIRELCYKYEIPIIEDAAEALGASYKGKYCGLFGDLGVLSFNGNKIITTSGGGMLIASEQSKIDKARFWATQAREKALHYQHNEIGYNYRLSNVLAGIGRGQLSVLQERVEKKREIFSLYADELCSLEGISFMPEAKYGRSNRWLTAIRLDPKLAPVLPQQLMEELLKNNIESRPVWKPMHLQPVFKEAIYYRHTSGRDVSATLFSEGVCLPSGTGMSFEEQMRVISIIKKMWK
nr:aminotransferase class I/II-fold pyridoxal phosphate-dependent enzyme [uncultured Anaeromusa sp.]